MQVDQSFSIDLFKQFKSQPLELSVLKTCATIQYLLKPELSY